MNIMQIEKDFVELVLLGQFEKKTAFKKRRHVFMMEREKLVSEVLRPVARIRTSKGKGSGTIIHSSEYGTYLLTNHHVVESNIEYKEVWDELLRRNVKKEFTSMVEVDINRLNEYGIVKGVITVDADIIISNSQQDLALLKLRDDIIYDTANWFPEELAEKIPILSELVCAGAAMGEKPIVTQGRLNGMQIEIDNYEYWLSSAPSIFGNSGGAVFVEHGGKWCYVGIPSRIRVAILGFSSDAVTHLGYFIPIFRIYRWLRDNCYDYLWDSSVTKEECDIERERRREKELALAAIREKG